MRVVAGRAGGLRLQAPRHGRLRPTSERVREALFASLGSLGAVEGATVLDLFAGTGALGIEALSRGAASAVFVDSDPAAVDAIRANLASTGLADGVEVVCEDAATFLTRSTRQYDVVLADPPYDFTGWVGIAPLLRGALLVVEARGPVDLGEGWQVVRTRRYGDTAVTLARAVRRA
ncbi:MAG: 16S rRNA (guanine(966)-N(2))-methyltransferase RsmD [Acidimicrobiales bacterium]